VVVAETGEDETGTVGLYCWNTTTANFEVRARLKAELALLLEPPVALVGTPLRREMVR
jgi:hypothetical protein